jgi:rubredoxin
MRQGWLVREFSVLCAQCGTAQRIYDPEGGDVSEEDAIRELEDRMHWSFVDGLWYCPQHAPAEE